MRDATRDGQLARNSSRRGSIVLPVASSDELKPGRAFAAMHWGRVCYPMRVSTS
ncbi:MAG: hypothetical protein IPO38_06210 [Rhodocyclaceae bacterium]|nr:hypothetical protein [Rhodocyclaceae bacterium]